MFSLKSLPSWTWLISSAGHENKAFYMFKQVSYDNKVQISFRCIGMRFEMMPAYHRLVLLWMVTKLFTET